MNKLTAYSRRFLDRFCKYLLIFLFFASFALSIFYSTKYFPLDLKMVLPESGEVEYHQRFAYEIEAWFQYGISLFGSVLCGIGLLVVAMISAYGVVCSFGFFSVSKDSLKGRKCLLAASIIGTMASFVLIMGFLLCGAHKWYAFTPFVHSLTPPWHIWLPLPAFLLLLCLSFLGKQDLVEIKKPVSFGKNTPITRIIFAVLAVFCIVTAVTVLSGQYKIPYRVSGVEIGAGKEGLSDVRYLFGTDPDYISPSNTAIAVGSVFCAFLLLFGGALAVLEGLSEYHHRFRSLGVISVSGILGFTYLNFGFFVLPDGSTAVMNNIIYSVPEFTGNSLLLFTALLVFYILYKLLRICRKGHKNEEST